MPVVAAVPVYAASAPIRLAAAQRSGACSSLDGRPGKEVFVEMLRGLSRHAEVLFAGRNGASRASRLDTGERSLLVPPAAADSRARVVAAVRPDLKAVSVRQVHGEVVLEYTANRFAGEPPSADGITATDGRVALTLVTADCLPVLLADGERVAAVHAGWRGFAAGIVERALEKFEDTGSITAWIGPAIGPCCYEVADEVAMAVACRAGAGCIRARSPRPHLDLPGAARRVLFDAGLRDVRASVICTRCDDRWASYRRDGQQAGRNVAAIWRRSSISESLADR